MGKVNFGSRVGDSAIPAYNLLFLGQRLSYKYYVVIKHMWAIGIKSGLITVLGLLAYGLGIQLMGLQHSLWGNLEYVVLALGIYSGHYYYKATNNGLMTYKQGLKLGLVIVSFAGLINALPVYLYVKLVDATFIIQLTKNVQSILKQKHIDNTTAEKTMQFMQHMTPEYLLIGILVSTVLLGFVLTLAIAACSKCTESTAKP